uniref:Zgc:162698 n=1 Tax=Esox lucius TaxID=8010 RepID=A0AAY5L020_ESOLU
MNYFLVQMASGMKAVFLPGHFSKVLFLLIYIHFTRPLYAVSEPGKWILDVRDETLKKQSFFLFTKTMFNSTVINLKWLSEKCEPPVKLSISWYLRSSRCFDEVFGLNPSNAGSYFRSTAVKQEGGSGFYVFHQYPVIECKQSTTSSKVQHTVTWFSLPPQHHFDAVARTWDDGPYMFIVHIEEVKERSNATPVSVMAQNWEIKLEVSMKGPHDYISASEWPLMIFYMVMCIIYVLLGVLWLGLSACFWRDLLRIQFWIGGVIFLGMLEKAVFYAEFQSIRYDGLSVQGAVVFGEVLSAVKRTLARVLVIIASLGYGISLTASHIFISLAQTMKLLRLRRNVVKLSLYRHFINTLIFAVIASVIFIIWTTKTFKFSKCQSDWRELWIDDAFWRFLFSILLLVIMFLWRPSANNQRYAYSPLVDEESDDEAKEQLMNEAFGKSQGCWSLLSGFPLWVLKVTLNGLLVDYTIMSR